MTGSVARNGFGGKALLLLAMVVLAACEREEPMAEPVDLSVEFGHGTALLITDEDTLHLDVEVAESEAQRRLGLMQRISLAPDSGMIFLFPEPQPAEGVFWMYNTLIPLSIAFLDEEGRIGSIRHMEPCTSPFPQYCPNYAAGVPFTSALEVNRGYFEEHGVEIGDRVVLHNVTP